MKTPLEITYRGVDSLKPYARGEHIVGGGKLKRRVRSLIWLLYATPI
jgi:hypothetical protein